MGRQSKPVDYPVCPYCGAVSILTDSKVVYGKSYGMIYLCRNYPKCDAYVGVHKRTNEPLGRLANPELRHWKKAAHSAFDKVWESGRMSRAEAYKWLSDKLRIDPGECHIGMFDVGVCKSVVSVCKNIDRGDDDENPVVDNPDTITGPECIRDSGPQDTGAAADTDAPF